MAFVDLEKAFDRVPREVVWWALRSLGVDEWLVCDKGDECRCNNNGETEWQSEPRV